MWVDLLCLIGLAISTGILVVTLSNRRYTYPEYSYFPEVDTDPRYMPGGPPIMSFMSRAVGYCVNADLITPTSFGGSTQVGCEDFSKGVFLLNHGETFYCPRCRVLGKIVSEHSSKKNDLQIYAEVRVEYNYDPDADIYRELAIVKDVSVMEPTNTYILYSPLIKTEKRALKVAEQILARLQVHPARNSEEVSTTPAEYVLDFADKREDFARKCAQFGETLQNSSLNSEKF